MGLAEKIKQQEEEGRKEGHASQGGGDWFKLVEGDNRFRVLTEPEMIFEKYKVGICYTECGYEGNAKFMCFVLDRKDGKIKLAKLPYTIGTTIAGYEADEEYAFHDYPMPFDIRVNAKDAGTKEVKYTVVPGRALVPLSEEILAELAKKTPVPDIITKMKEKKKEEHVASGFWQENQDRKAKLQEDMNAAYEKNAADKKDEITYPTEEINPEDIPF